MQTTSDLIAEAREKFLQNFPDATADELASVSRDGISLEQKSALNKLTEEARQAERAAALVQQMKDRYAAWKADRYPADDVLDLKIMLAVGLKI